MYVGHHYDDVALFSVIQKTSHDYGNIVQFLHIIEDVLLVFFLFVKDNPPSLFFFLLLYNLAYVTVATTFFLVARGSLNGILHTIHSSHSYVACKI